ncbi:expressed unknown protein [Seminavis robusta]|uniref:Uncharacterized protein n=1 Tax=Seminavis robusta TaxID=568900 RepID=A0A9N8EUP3_9STRA|nr:expressed unknown protein [Seminavis robusta]|eukprot:Sro1673_g290270.1 n/a (302) ;mRNA; f:16057-16962
MSGTNNVDGDDDSSRLLLLLTDILGDLKIVNNKSKSLWTPESVRALVVQDGDKGGMFLVLQLLNIVDTRRRKPRVSSWEDIRLKYAALWPPFVSAENLSEEPIVSKLEVLVFAASAVQRKALRDAKTGDDGKKRSPKKEENEEKQETESAKAVETTSSTGGSMVDLPISLPSHFTEEQQAWIRECYEGFRADYNQRRRGMQQRLDIMACNFLADNKDDPEMVDVRQKVQSLSLSSPLTTDLNQQDLHKHFTTPHSFQVDKSTAEALKKATRVDTRTAVDRGGRTDGSNSRSTMPKWVDKDS